ncbi:MAG: hypothetical protein ACE5E5_12270 [Phycisphaerae bacterium]
MLHIPHVREPDRYVGLCVFDFGAHVSIGYTAGEIRVLQSQQTYASGQAYEIYRVTETGGFELRGVSVSQVGAMEALCFLYGQREAARAQYEWLCETARGEPISCETRIHLARLDDFEPPDVVALAYLGVVSNVVAAWLERVGFSPAADDVIAGGDAYESVRRGAGQRRASGFLASRWDYRDRSREELLASVDLAVQR